MPYLHKDALGVGASDAMHGVKGELEVGAAQQMRQAVEVIDAPQHPQVVLHLIDDLSAANVHS